VQPQLSLQEFSLVFNYLDFHVRPEVFTAVTLTNAIIWDMELCGLVESDVLEENVASIFRLERMSELGKTLAVTIKRLVVPISLILSTLKMDVTSVPERSVLLRPTRHHIPRNSSLHGFPFLRCFFNLRRHFVSEFSCLNSQEGDRVLLNE
jgi:hypothetical protein